MKNTKKLMNIVVLCLMTLMMTGCISFKLI